MTEHNLGSAKIDTSYRNEQTDDAATYVAATRHVMSRDALLRRASEAKIRAELGAWMNSPGLRPST